MNLYVGQRVLIKNSYNKYYRKVWREGHGKEKSCWWVSKEFIELYVEEKLSIEDFM